MSRIASRLAVALLACAATGTAAAQDVTLRFHHFLPPASNFHAKGLVPWSEKVTRESNGRIRFQLFPALQLGGTVPQLFDQAKDGVADIVWTQTGVTAGRFPRVEVFELPFVMTDVDGTSRAIWEFFETNKEANAEFRDVKPIGFFVHGPGVIHSRDKAIRTLGDLRGMKVRGSTRLATRLLATLGATPVGMPITGVAEGMSKGVIDAAMTSWEVVPAIRLQELSKFSLETDPKAAGIFTSVFIIAMNRAKYDAMPADLKRVFDANTGIVMSEFFGKVFEDADASGRKSIETRGNTIVTLKPADTEAWKKAAAPVYDAWFTEMQGKGIDGKALLEQATRLIEKNTRK